MSADPVLQKVTCFYLSDGDGHKSPHDLPDSEHIEWLHRARQAVVLFNWRHALQSSPGSEENCSR